MSKKLFVLFVVVILVGSITCLVIYDKNVIKNEEARNKEMENIEIIDDGYDETEDVDEEQDTEDIGNDETIGSLVIEKINLNGKVKEGSTTEVLKDYIGHIEETSKYDGNVGLAAHNRGNEHSYFARINELEPGDEIKYQTQYGQRIYKVDYKKEILETDWEPLKSSDINKLTLITCIKNKVNQRLCLQATEIK